MKGEDVRKKLLDNGYVLKDVAEAMGIIPQNLQTYLNSDDIKTGVLERIANAISKNTYFFYASNDDEISPGTSHQLAGYSTIPLIPVDAIAGFPNSDISGITVADCEHYIIPEFRSLKVEFLIRVSGSSMYPKYSNGDILACRKVKSPGFLQWGKVYVLDTEQGALVKRIFEDKDNSDCIICHSDNTERYPDFKIPKGEIRSYSIVIGAIRVE